MTTDQPDIQHIQGPGEAYPILLGEGILPTIGTQLRHVGLLGKCAVVTNATIAPHYAEPVMDSLADAGFVPTLCQIPDGEQFKTLDTVASLYNQFIEAGLERKSPILALGGGVLGDTVGFAAASYLRGVPFVQIPTTLLAMVDSSVGGKTGVDLPQGKNLVGAFKQPELVIIDPGVLASLPAKEFRSGLAEVVKHGIIDSPTLFKALQTGGFEMTWLLAEAISVKVRVVDVDPYEQGIRATLNLGHTFGHAFEQLSEYQIRHGEGVAMGIACATRLARRLEICSSEDADTIINLLEYLDMPTEHPGYEPNAVWAAMATDKKKEKGNLRFILPRSIGDVDVFNDIAEDDVKEILAS